MLVLMLLAGSGCEIRHRGEEAEPQQVATGEQDAVADDLPGVAAPGPDPDDDRSVAQRLEDASVAARVKLALADERQLRLFDFEPRVHEGTVTLEGEVSSVTQYTLAEQVARRVDGVRDVENALVAPGVDPEQMSPRDVTNRVPADEDTVDVARSSSSADTGASSPSSASSSATYHTVASGESLWEIARSNGTSIDALRRLNNLQGDRLRPGQRLRVR